MEISFEMPVRKEPTVTTPPSTAHASFAPKDFKAPAKAESKAQEEDPFQPTLDSSAVEVNEDEPTPAVEQPE